MNKSAKRFTAAFGIIVIIAICIGGYYWNKNEETIDKHQTSVIDDKEPILDDEDLYKLLPITFEVAETDIKRETIAYRLWFELMAKFKENQLLTNTYFTRFHLLDGDENAFTVAVVFQVELGEDVQNTSWGNVKADGLVWKLKIEKDADQTYTLNDVEMLSDRLIGLPPVENLETYKKEAVIPQKQENNRYEIVNDSLRVTHNNGVDWIDVPASLESFFEGEYNGSRDELIESSYMITPERIAFVLGGNNSLRLLQTTDQGKTWDEVLITDQLPVVRKRLLGFTSEKNGYLIVTADRTMSSEMNIVLKTNDGGKSWDTAGGVEESNRLVTDGGFIDDNIGFMSFGAVNFEDQPPRPSLFRTGNGGSSWEEVEIPIPDEFKGIFTTAETPIFNQGKGSLLVNQGPDGDYVGGKVLAKFTSDDEGKTWTLKSFVDPDNVLGE